MVRCRPLVKPDVPSLNPCIALNLKKPKKITQIGALRALAHNRLKVLRRAEARRVERSGHKVNTYDTANCSKGVSPRAFSSGYPMEQETFLKVRAVHQPLA
jgi:hypothetical protein